MLHMAWNAWYRVVRRQFQRAATHAPYSLLMQPTTPHAARLSANGCQLSRVVAAVGQIGAYCCAMNNPLFLRSRTPVSAQIGLTLIELMVSIALLAVVMGLAAPSFGPTIKRWRLNDARDAFISTIYLARSEALKLGGNVVLERNSPDNMGAASCPQVGSDSGNWGCGWTLWHDKNNNGSRDNDEAILQTTSPHKQVNVMARFGGSNRKLKFDRWGQANGISAFSVAFTPEPEGVTSTIATTICVASGGRIRTVEGAEDDACQ